MNKIQYIKLLNLRGITELKGISIAKAIEQSGGEPTDKEMAEVNKQAMQYFIEQNIEKEKEIETLKTKVSTLTFCLEVQKIEKEINSTPQPIHESPTQERLAFLEERNLILLALEGAGVDNWEGYDIAMESYKDLL
jgi:hypothetical protein